jgi:hypothetical protein
VNPIYIPSKGRPNAESKTARGLLAEDIPFTFVVELQDFEMYNDIWGHADPGFLVLPQNDLGPWQARQAALRQARSRTQESVAMRVGYHWQLDDDIDGLQTRDVTIPGSLYRPTDWKSGLLFAEMAALEHPTVTLLGLVQRQFGWSADKPWRFNTKVNAAMLIRSDARGKFRPDPILKEDWDFSLQVLSSGQDTMLIQTYAISTTQGTGEGGCQPMYQAGKGTEAAYRLAQLWPDHVTVAEKYGRIDNRVSTRAFKRDVPRAELV